MSDLPPEAQQNATIVIEIWERIAVVLIVNSTADAAAMASELEAGPLCSGTDTCTVVYQAGTRRLSAKFAENSPSSARRLSERADYVATRTYAEDTTVRPLLLVVLCCCDSCSGAAPTTCPVAVAGERRRGHSRAGGYDAGLSHDLSPQRDGDCHGGERGDGACADRR